MQTSGPEVLLLDPRFAFSPPVNPPSVWALRAQRIITDEAPPLTCIAFNPHLTLQDQYYGLGFLDEEDGVQMIFPRQDSQ